MLVGGSLAFAGAAAADDGQGGANVAVLGDIVHGGTVDILNASGHVVEQPTGGTIQLKLKDATLETYCIDIHNPTRGGTEYNETDWDHSVLSGKKEQLGKIRWILQHAYPVVDPATLGGKAGVTLNDDTAAAATQAAIWHFSDGVDAHPQNKAADKVTQWLEAQADQNGGVEEPLPSLQLNPDSVSGNSGEKVGPITVSTSADKVALDLDAAAKAAGVTLVNESGQAATSAVNGDKLFFDVPANAPKGQGAVTASTTTQIEVGRVFGPVDKKSQTLILAGSSSVPVSASATGAWAPKAHQGPIPAVTFEKDCTAGGVQVTATNSGDEDFTFTLNGETHTVQPGKSETVLVKVAEDQQYDIKIEGPAGYGPWETTGVLDCKTATTAGGTTGGTTTGGATPSASPSVAPSASPSTGTTTGGATGTAGTTTGGGLAETGSSSATPVIAGIAAALVVIGGGVVFFLRKRRSTPSA
ncbi:thioester domain-containing protein [Streptacidiphilus griseoplanus]|uniref:thioester domain-containing protein n=1 Tax=Peterkaempfera griseoplana TaxID=66896 RepID=UPI001FDEF738|nr:thioester domain-containing protein [Peterkaempfera griseoplana]